MAIEMRVAFDDTDAGGIVFFGNYFRLAHRALEEYLPTIGISWNSWFDMKEVLVPLRHVEAEYLEPLRLGEHFSVEVEVLRVGETSVQFRFLLKGPEQQTKAIVKTTHVFLSAQSRMKCPIPPPIREILSRLIKKS